MIFARFSIPRRPARPSSAPRFSLRGAAGLALCATLAAVSMSRAAPPAGDPKDLREAQAALSSLAGKHRSAQALSLVFESRAEASDGSPMPAAKGSLTAADSGRFRLQHAQGLVVCDGRTVWQYFPSTKQVVVKNASDAADAGGVLLRFLQARAVRADRAKGGLMRVVLDPASVGESLDSLVVTLATAEPSVRRVLTQDPAGNRVEYAVKSLRYDARPGRAAFAFKPPAGVEVIDMR